MFKYGLILFFIVIDVFRLTAQGSSQVCVKSTEGKEFWFGFMENRISYNPLYPPNYLEITLTSKNTCHYSYSIGTSAIIISGNLQPNMPQKIRIDRLSAEPYGSENIESKAIHLQSDQPLNIYAMNWSYNSSDAAVIFPVEALGKEYFAMCYEPNVMEQPDGSPWNGKNSEFVVVASEDQTQVTITPSKVTDKLKPANVPYTVFLNKGELYQVQSMNHPNLPGQGDLTGTYIKSNKPIALYSGSWATTVPNSSSYAWDHLYEQIPPLQSWGRKFVSVPLKSRGKDTYRILASVDQTTVKIAEKMPILLNRGQFYEFMLNADEPSLIESDHPVLLAQYSNSNDVDHPAYLPPGETWDGDPSMLIVSPVDQTREEVTFVAYDTPEIYQKFYVNIVTRDNSVNQILLDDQPVDFISLPNSGYSYAQVKISIGNHNLISTEAGKGFIAYVYGFGGVESYGYSVGFNLSTRLDLGGDIHFVKDTILLCNGDSKVLDAGSHFSTFLWNTGETTQKISVSKKGYYSVTASTLEGCQLSAGITAIESHPEVQLGKDTTTLCLPGTLVLDAGNFSSWHWSTLDTTRFLTVKLPGLYGVIIQNKFGCLSRDSILVQVSNRPKLIIGQLDTMVCGNKSEIVKITADKGNYSLRSSDPTVAIQYLTATVPNFGIYPLTFSATDQYACATDTTFLLRFRKNTSVAIGLDSTCIHYNLDARYVGDAVLNNSQFTWIFAGDTIANGVAKDHIHMQLGSVKEKKKLSLQVSEAGCTSATVARDIDVVPDLSFVVSDTLLCQLAEFKFHAANSENVVDYAWNWGDGSIEHLTSDAVHAYSKAGNYTIQLTAKTDKNCTNTIQKLNFVTVAPIPTVEFSMLENQCLKAGSHTLAYVGPADTKDRFLWDLTSLAAADIIKNPLATIGPLIFDLKSRPNANVSLQVVSKFGCSSSVKTIQLQRKPLFDLSISDSIGCTPFSVNMSARTIDPVDQVDYKWNFGDGKIVAGNDIVHIFDIPDNKYNLSLVATSSTTGCIDTLQKSNFIKVLPTPKASFSVDQNIFLSENPSVTFQNLSLGGDRYAWNFGDGSGSIEKDPVHQFLVTGIRTIWLDAFNKAGCVDSTSQNISIALSKIYTPNAFSPGATNEIDREFRLFTNGMVEEGYHLIILSRWNDVVFECRNEARAWNGKTSGGSMAPAGNYIWILEFRDFLGKAHRQMGTVMLLY
jgi:PKD repeat protein